MLGKLSTQDKSIQYVRIFSADARSRLSSNIYYFIAGDRFDGDIFEMSEDIHRVFINSKKVRRVVQSETGSNLRFDVIFAIIQDFLTNSKSV